VDKLFAETGQGVIEVNLFRLFTMLLAILLAMPHQLMAEEEESTQPQPIFYYQLKPSLVANLSSGGHYVRCDIQLMTHDQDFLAILRLHTPAIRHTLLLLLSDQDGNSIKTPGGKETLRQEALSQINRLLKEQSGKAGVESLFFTTFFVQ
jgi:flagellar FliL protein